MPLKPEELEQLLAPIALYPDSLLAQILMASTYPLEVVQAERAVKENPGLKDDAAALNKLTYDPSVKSLINFPQVLTMMSEKLDWTLKLGDAFLADQKSVMDTVQKLRGKAYAQGNLKTTSEQKVTVQPTTQPAAAAAQAPAQVYVVESTSPSVVYVPTYNPTVVYGGWPYPAYPPPAPYYPPGYVAGTAMISFGIGVACGAAWGNAWGDCDWDGGDVNIDVDKNFNFNQNIDRDKFKAEYNKRNQGQGAGDGRGQGQRGQGQFKHDPSHRQGVAYRDQAAKDRYGGSANDRARAQSREAYRGRADAGRQDLSRGGNRAGGSAGRTGSQDFQRNGGGRQNSYSNRSASGGRSSGFGGVNSGRSGATAASNRGQTSRSGGYSGGGRSAPRGGGSRGGGGRGGRR